MPKKAKSTRQSGELTMPKKAKKSTKKSNQGGSKAELSKSRGHKPVAVLESFHAKMIRNIDKLGNLIERRKASGE